MPRFRDTADAARMGADILSLPADDRDKLARMHWGQPWNPGVHERYAEDLARGIEGFCRQHELDIEEHTAIVVRTAVEDIKVA